MIRKIPVLTIGAYLLFFYFMPAIAETKTNMTPAISAEGLKSLQAESKSLVIVDVRKSAEYRTGHIPGSINIPYKKIKMQLDKIRGSEAIVVYCYNGKRTRKAEEFLLKNEIANVSHLQGGLLSWRRQGYQVKTGWKP